MTKGGGVLSDDPQTGVPNLEIDTLEETSVDLGLRNVLGEPRHGLPAKERETAAR